MIVVDSGLGGISVVRALRASNPTLALTYIADTAGFPYGSRSAGDISTRAETLIRAASPHAHAPVVLACNTLSTLCLESLRTCFAMPFVGTVPAIKVAASLSRTRRFTLLATPNTADSAYTKNLIHSFAEDCVVDRYGAPGLAAMAEQMLLGEPVSPETLRAELAPAFHDDAAGKTDAIVLGCTHYPLILDALRRVAPWEVMWIDSADAIARRAGSLADVPPTASVAYVTREPDVARYRALFTREGFSETRFLRLS